MKGVQLTLFEIERGKDRRFHSPLPLLSLPFRVFFSTPFSSPPESTSHCALLVSPHFSFQLPLPLLTTFLIRTPYPPPSSPSPSSPPPLLLPISHPPRLLSVHLSHSLPSSNPSQFSTGLRSFREAARAAACRQPAVSAAVGTGRARLGVRPVRPQHTDGRADAAGQEFAAIAPAPDRRTLTARSTISANISE